MSSFETKVALFVHSASMAVIATTCAGLLACGPGNSCGVAADCTLPQTCNAQHLCAVPEPVAEGEPCLHDLHCISGSCGTLDADPVCVTPCADRSACGPLQACLPVPVRDVAPQSEQELHLLCAPAPAGDRYVGEACEMDDDCRDGLCAQGHCVELCGECAAGFACESTELERSGLTLALGLCTRQPLIRVVELGAVDTPVEGALPVALDVHAGDGPFILFAVGPDDSGVAIRRLEAPDGTLLTDLEDPATGVISYGYPHFGAATTMLPGTDDERAALQVGTYQAWVATYDPDAYRAADPQLLRVNGQIDRVAAVFRQPAGEAGLLDLNIYLAPATGLDAASAEESAFLRDTIARLRELYQAQIGVDIGEVRYADLTADEDVVETGDDARRIVSTYGDAGPNGVSMNLFIVADLAFADGFASIAPGVPGLVNRPVSGVVVQRLPTPERMGALMAHELGHYLGLLHTSASGGVTDFINDTPVCAADVLNTNFQACPDADNMMFPLFDSTGEMPLTPGQRRVARSSPWFYEISYPHVCGADVPATLISQRGFAGGTTAGGSSMLAGSCGGDAYGERVHLYRLEQDAYALHVELLAHGFDPVLHLRRDTCDDIAAELACTLGTADEPLTLTIDQPAAGAYYLIVDGKDGEGRYELNVQLEEQPPPGP